MRRQRDVVERQQLPIGRHRLDAEGLDRGAAQMAALQRLGRAPS